MEHRAAPGLNDIAIELTDDGKGPALRLSQAGDEEAVGQSPEQRLLQVLAEADTPLSLRQLRERATLRTATVGAAVRTLRRQRRIERAPQGGYRLAGDADKTVNGEALPKTVTGPKP